MVSMCCFLFVPSPVTQLSVACVKNIWWQSTAAIIVQSFVMFSVLVLAQWSLGKCPPNVVSHCMSRTSHSPFAKWAANAPKPSECLPSRQPSCNLEGCFPSSYIHRHHVPRTFYCPAGEEEPNALGPCAFLHHSFGPHVSQRGFSCLAENCGSVLAV